MINMLDHFLFDKVKYALRLSVKTYYLGAPVSSFTVMVAHGCITKCRFLAKPSAVIPSFFKRFYCRPSMFECVFRFSVERYEPRYH